MYEQKEIIKELEIIGIQSNRNTGAEQFNNWIEKFSSGVQKQTQRSRKKNKWVIWDYQVWGTVF